MADASYSSNPHGWGEAFAALPLDAPSTSRWPGVAAQLVAQRDAGTRRARKHVRLALAASLFALAALPAVRMLRDDPVDIGRTRPSTASTSASTSASPTTLPVDDAATRDPIRPDIDRISHAVGTTDHRSTATRIATAMPATRPRAAVDPRRHQARERRIAAAQPTDVASNLTNNVASLESLYTASAQLENLLAFARDTRVESAPAASLAGAFDAELATIDARLAQPGLGATEQRMLWQARVETLQRSAGFESHLRLLAADGERLDGALVSVD
jgi:hypothetical protein